jgi:hypothetical protein
VHNPNCAAKFIDAGQHRLILDGMPLKELQQQQQQQQQHPEESIFMDAAIEQDIHQISRSHISNEERLPDYIFVDKV